MNSLAAPQFINLNHTKTQVQVQPVGWYGKGWFLVLLRSLSSPCEWSSSFLLGSAETSPSLQEAQGVTP